MTQSINIYKPKISSIFSSSYLKVTNRGKFYKILLFILGLPVHIVTVLTFYFGKGQNQYGNAYKSCEEQLVSKGLLGSWRKQFLEQENTKATFFHETLTAEQLNKKQIYLFKRSCKKK